MYIGTVRVKCLAQDTLTPARDQTHTGQSGVQSNNHEAAPHLPKRIYLCLVSVREPTWILQRVIPWSISLGLGK